MSSADILSIERFNQQVLSCQEKAFTLAHFLWGDKNLACELLQEVILRVYSGWKDDGNTIEVKVMRWVIEICRPANPKKIRAAKELIPGWNQLEPYEKEALLLVDVLGNSYEETGNILNRSEREVALFVAHGRCKLNGCLKMEDI